MRAIVVGAGLGGLAAAAGLGRLGWDVQVLERRDSLREAGSGLSLWPNALRALEGLGVGRELWQGATIGGDSGVRRPDGRWIARTSLGSAVQSAFGEPLVIVHRSQVLDALARAVGPDVVRTSSAVAAVDPFRGTIDVGGRTVAADLIVAADGARSTIRSALHPGTRLRPARYRTWRMITERVDGAVRGSETWGRHGDRFAVLPMNDGRVYSYAVVPTAQCDPGVEELELLRRRFGSWHEPIPAILAAATSSSVIRADIHELASPVPSMVSGSLALIGDAAHPMTPDLGQGGGIALEDGLELALAVAGAGTSRDVPEALRAFDRRRRPRAALVTARSHQAGALYGYPAWVQGAAARVMGHLPAPAIARGLAPIVDWRPSGRLL